MKRVVKPYTPSFLLDCYRGVRRLLKISPHADVAKQPTGELPVLVYQMGKVGSRSILEALRKAPGIDVFHVHRIGADIHPNLARRISARKERAKIITMVRDPISRNISSYFHLLDNHFKTRDAHRKYSTEEITAYFFEYIMTDVEDAIGWFDEEFGAMTGIDIYQHEFPAERKWSRIESDPYEVLILRVDLEDARKQEVICDFLGIDELRLARSNKGDARPNGVEYKRFAGSIRLPQEYLQRNLESRFTRHFYSDQEIRQMYDRWQDA